MWVITFSAAILCASLPALWYLFSREIMPKTAALITAILIGITPSLLTIYRFFANETLLLPLMALAFYLSIRCYKTKNSHLFIAAGVVWFLAGLTRVIAFPPAILCIVFLLFSLQQRVKPALLLLLLITPLAGFVAWSKQEVLGYYTIVGAPEINQVYARSDAKRLRIFYEKESKGWFQSPALFTMPLTPLSDWMVHKSHDIAFIHINPKEGKNYWDRALNDHPFTWHGLTKHMLNNVIFLFFGPSWPEVNPPSWESYESSSAEQWLNRNIRWIWLPLFLFVLFGVKMPRQGIEKYFPLLTLGMFLLLSIQYTSVLEGRYRKPLEPMLIISASLVFIEIRKCLGQKPIKPFM
jgi:hypothetical protein